MKPFGRPFVGGKEHKYTLLGEQNASPMLWTRKHSALAIVLLAFAGIATVLVSSSYDRPCDTIKHGYQCNTEISHYWGQYSPYFSVQAESNVPDPGRFCNITFVQALSRHGARDPTFDKSLLYNATVQKIKSNVAEFKGDYAFLADYQYALGADQLNAFGRQQLVNSGVQFYERYKPLSRDFVPFVRAAGQKRVVDSAHEWTKGFRLSKEADDRADHGQDAYPEIDVVISEGSAMNNTLHHNLCTEFETGKYSLMSHEAQSKWANIFVPGIQSRLNADLPGANLSITETIYVMDLCAFDTVASPSGKISSFCNLFSEDEWHQYNYYNTLGKWYGYADGNPLGPTQGVGFVNELIARMTDEAVHDHTSTNHTIDQSAKTFPFDRRLYADFSHDNEIVAALSAVGLFSQVGQLPNTTMFEAPEAGGFSTSWVVPFAARVYFEKMQCVGSDEELVRVVVNDRIMPLPQCNANVANCCTLDNFISSLGFAIDGGLWNQCFLG